MNNKEKSTKMEIIETIDRFLKSRKYHYALLINGMWGIGKTYYVKKTLIPHFNELGCDINYLSLYGINSTEEISQVLCLQAIKDKAPDEVKRALESKGGQTIAKVFSTVFKGVMNHFGIENPEIGSIVQMLPNYDNNVIIFDDLERCGCPVNEVLGYINDFVEHSNAAVIIVANEDEIGKWQLDRNPELQMLIAMDPRLIIDKTQEIKRSTYGNNNQSGNQENKVFTPEEIEVRRKACFHSNDAYKTIKEKVIGLTINYEPDLMSIFKALIEKNIESDLLKESLLSDLEWYVGAANKDEHKNLRTFQFFLEKADLIFRTISEKYPSLHQQILRYTFRSSIRFMKGITMPEWEADYGNQIMNPTKMSIMDYELGFRFVDDLIEKNTIDPTYVKDVLTRFEETAKKKALFANDPYQLIREWWVTEDEQLASWLDSIKVNILSGKYSTELYTDLIRRISELKAHQVMNEKCDAVFDAMQEYIKSADPCELEDLESERFILEGEISQLYKMMHKQINELLNNRKSLSEKQKYEEAIIDKEHWGANLNEASNNNGALKGHSFVYWLDPQQIVALVSRSNNYELDQFRWALQRVYGERVYYEKKADDYDHLKAMREGIDGTDKSSWGQIKRAYCGLICGDIDRYLRGIILGDGK